MHKTHLLNGFMKKLSLAGRADHLGELILGTTVAGWFSSSVPPARFRQIWSQLNCLAARFYSMLFDAFVPRLVF
jgi:hypothetical protein